MPGSRSSVVVSSSMTAGPRIPDVAPNLAPSYTGMRQGFAPGSKQTDLFDFASGSTIGASTAGTRAAGRGRVCPTAVMFQEMNSTLLPSSEIP